MPTTDERRMSPLVRRLRRQIAKEGGYACFAEQMSVEQAIFAYAAAIGTPVTELLAEWADRPAEVVRKRTSTPAQPSDTDDEDQPGDDDSDTEQVCPSCGGKGRGPDGDVCDVCDGSGRVAAEDPDDNDNDDENEKKSYKHEFIEEE